jgi:hypothetical protein
MIPAAWYGPLTLAEQQELRAKLYSSINATAKLCNFAAPSAELWGSTRELLGEVADLHRDLCNAPLPGTRDV